MDQKFDTLIVGGGHAGAQAAIALRQIGFTGTIALISNEEDLPYERPPLTKDYLSGNKSFDRIVIRPAAYWADKSIQIFSRMYAAHVNPLQRVVTASCGQRFAYRKLIWATGGTARPLSCPGSGLPGVCSIRSRADADSVQAQLRGVRDVAIVGGGYVGLESAAVLTKLDKKVTLFEMADRLLARVSGTPVSQFLETEHRAHGVDIRLNAHIIAIEGNERVRGVRTAADGIIPAQLVIVGIGLQPSVQPLLDAKAEGHAGGIKVDVFCRTSLPHIFAIGDCAIHPNRFAGGHPIRLESVQNAHDMAFAVAETIAGVPTAYETLPWFWSNQYDLKLQTIGLSTGYDECLLRGDAATRSFSVIYRKQGTIVALDCINAMKDFVQGKALIGQADIDADALADLSIPLKVHKTTASQH